MMWRWLLIYFALGSSFVHSQQHDAAFEAIADYSVNRDAVFKRHAMFAIVELRDHTQTPVILPVCYFSLFGEGMEYRGECVMDGAGGKNQRWWQVFRKNDKMSIVRYGMDKWVDRKADESYDDFNSRVGRVGYFSPLDGFAYGQFFYGRKPLRLDAYITRSNMDCTSSVKVGHEFQTKWFFDAEQETTKVIFDLSKGTMPISVRMKGKNRDQLARLNWAQIGKLWVPTHLRFVDQTSQQEVFAKMRWIVGDKVPDQIFKLDRDRLRIEVPKLFGFVADGSEPYVPGSPYVAPPDLYEDIPNKNP